jgi:hypothetical protein
VIFKIKSGIKSISNLKSFSPTLPSVSLYGLRPQSETSCKVGENDFKFEIDLIPDLISNITLRKIEMKFQLNFEFNFEMILF